MSDGEVLLGQVGAFTGSSAWLGTELWRGEVAAFDAANTAGGVAGRRFRVRVADDSDDPSRAAAALLTLAQDEQVFALLGGDSPQAADAALPVLMAEFHAHHLFSFASSNDAALTSSPGSDAAFAVLAPYAVELDAAAAALASAHLVHVGLYAAGAAAWTGSRGAAIRALSARGITVVEDVAAPERQPYTAPATGIVARFQSVHVGAILVIGAPPEACAALVRDARRAALAVPILDVAFLEGDQILELLQGEPDHALLVRDLFAIQPVPSTEDTRLPAVVEYRGAIREDSPQAPFDQVPESSYHPAHPFSAASLAGFLRAKVFLAVVDRVGRSLTRTDFYQAAESTAKMDLGLGTPVTFSPVRHHGLDQAWFVAAEGDRWKPVDDPEKALQ